MCDRYQMFVFLPIKPIKYHQVPLRSRKKTTHYMI